MSLGDGQIKVQIFEEAYYVLPTARQFWLQNKLFRAKFLNILTQFYVIPCKLLPQFN